MSLERTKDFESRKADHLRLALDPSMEALGAGGFERVRLLHEALPEIDLASVELETNFWKYRAASPFFISSMTAGHHQGEAINITLARVAAARRWPMGLGSQRRELGDPNAKAEWARLRKAAPGAFLMSNLGLSQLIVTPLAKVFTLVETLGAGALFIHTNPMQEALQPEGTPQFKGGLKALEAVCKKSPVPVILKETGCGFSAATLKRLRDMGLAAVDVSGLGGTHWGRIEGGRAPLQSAQKNAAATFANWGESTVDSLLNAAGVKLKAEIWASGGIRSGLDAAKAIALGAKKVGFAKPALVTALEGDESLSAWMTQMEFELKTALFCSGLKTPEALRKGKRWQRI
jgi:isopentenyl-diphosphate Delta-isomerase